MRIDGMTWCSSPTTKSATDQRLTQDSSIASWDYSRQEWYNRIIEIGRARQVKGKMSRENKTRQKERKEERKKKKERKELKKEKKKEGRGKGSQER